MMIHSPSAAATQALGYRLGRLLEAGDLVALSGELGTGKTVLTRGIAEGAGVVGYVASPTFTFIREYHGPVPIYHVDLYRVEDPKQLEDLGLEELATETAIVVIEWAEKATSRLPPEHLWISLKFANGDEHRELHLRPRGVRYARLVAALAEGTGQVS